MRAHDDDTNGGDEAFDNMQTWPKSQLSHRGLSELHEWIQLETILNQAKSFVRSSGGGDKIASPQHSGDSENLVRMQAATQLIKRLSKELEMRVKDTSNRVGVFRKRHESVGTPAAELLRPHYNSTTATSTTNMNVIREDPHFESMIICDTTTAPSKGYGSMDTVRSISRPSFSIRSPVTNDYDNKYPDCAFKPPLFSPIIEPVTVAEMPGESTGDPITLRAIPHLLLLTFVVCYLVGGAYLFCLLDDRIKAKPFRVVLLFAFQTCTSIGWGDTSPTNRWSQLFCVIYTIFGVPIFFSAFANIGRLMTEFYCIDWLFLTAVVRERVKIYTDKIFPGLQDCNESDVNFQTLEVRRRFPIRATINLLFIHQCIGVLLYGSLLKQYTVIQVIYFSITSMSTTGYGDIHPAPETLSEAIIAIVYISTGIIIFSALLLFIGYHFQRIIYVILPNYLHYCYERYCGRSVVAVKNDVSDDGKHIDDVVV